VVVLAACGEPPSYQLRWSVIDAEGQGEALTQVSQCSEVGVSAVRVTTLVGGDDLCTGLVVDEREYPCRPDSFAAEQPVDGPTLEPGAYTVLLQGLRRDGDPWYCAADDLETSCTLDEFADPCVARAVSEVSVAEGALPLVEGELLAPLACDDGIDNDRDGKVDGQDPGCILDDAGREDAELGITLFQTTVAFLDSRVIRPSNIGVQSLQLDIDGAPFATVPIGALDFDRWPFGIPLQVTRELASGNHTLSMTALASDGTALTETQTLATPFLVDEGAANYVTWDVAFTDDSFLEPIIQPISMIISLQLGPDVASTCELGGFDTATTAPIPVERVFVRVLDENGQPLDAATLALNGTAHAGGAIAAVDEADGWVSFACPSSDVESQPLTWGRYTVEIEAQAGGDPCFEWSPADDWQHELAPQPINSQAFALSRLPGTPAPGCVECGVPGRVCSGQVCVDGLCVDG
jgi:hypothetical protein